MLGQTNEHVRNHVGVEGVNEPRRLPNMQDDLMFKHARIDNDSHVGGGKQKKTMN